MDAVALTTEWAYEEARSQGYVPPARRRVLGKSAIGGVESPVSLVVLAP